MMDTILECTLFMLYTLKSVLNLYINQYNVQSNLALMYYLGITATSQLMST